MDRSERRRYKRLGARFDVSCREVGCRAEQSKTGYTVNVSPGGLYFETTCEAFRPGSLLKVELSIPPTAGLLEFGGKLAGFAKVLRSEDVCDFLPGTDSTSDKYGVALQFCRPLKLCT